MEEWKECKLGDYCDFQNGYAFKSSEFKTNGEYKIVKIKELKDGLVKFFDDSASVDIQDIKEFEKYKIYRNDVLFALTGDPVSKPNPLSWVGRVSIYRSDENALLNQRTCKIKKSERIDNKFLYYYFRQWENFYALASKATGSASQANISTNTIADTIIKLPPLPTQQKIAATLSSLDDKIELNNKINTNLEQQAHALFKNWFVDFEPFDGKMPEGWKIGKLSDISILSAGGDKPKEVSDKATEENKFPIYSNGLDNFGLYGYTNNAKIFEESVTVSARGTIGFVCLRMEPYVPIVILISVIPKTDFVSAKYLYLHLLNCNIAGTGTTQQQLTVPAFSKEQVIIPSKNVIDSFTNTVNHFFEMIVHNRKENEKLSSMRDTLLPKLMNGEIGI